MVDELTGISNRKAFDRRLDLEWRRAARYGRSLGLMVMDLDGFKQVNDIKGHAAGDVRAARCRPGAGQAHARHRPRGPHRRRRVRRDLPGNRHQRTR